MKTWLKNRFAEASTYAGLAALIPTIAQAINHGWTPTIIGTLAAGIAAVLMPEQANRQHLRQDGTLQ